jgi:hypothetical protein
MPEPLQYFETPTETVVTPTQNSWDSAIAEVRAQPPNTYPVKGRVGVKDWVSRYAVDRLIQAKQAVEEREGVTLLLTIWHKRDVEVHRDVPDGRGGHKSVETKLDTWTAYVRVDEAVGNPQGDTHARNPHAPEDSRSTEAAPAV